MKQISYYLDSNVMFVPISHDILKGSAGYVHKYNISADDALHVYVACRYRCNYFICADQKLASWAHPDIRGPIFSDITLRDIENGKPLTAVTRINGEYGPVIGEARVISGDPNSLVSITAHYGGEGIAPSSATLPLRAPPT